MKNIKGYDVVVFAMHGNHSTPRYNTSSQLPIFSINETVTTTTDKAYSYELNTRNSVRKVTLTTGELKYLVFPRLFEDNYSSTSLKGQMIFSESCKFYGCDCLSTTPDNSMARVFTQKGAPVVVGYHNSVGADYSRDIMKDVVESTFNGNTVTSAVNTAKNAHGVNDANRTDGMERVNDDKYKAYPCIIGNENFVLRADGSLSGVVLNAATEQAIAKATVRVYKDGIEIKKTTTSASGAYKITGLDAGSYILQISASKYKSVRTGITILPGEDTFVETTLLMSISGIVSSSANGTVTNSVTGEGVADVTIKVRNNWNNETGAVKSTSKTNENGYYSISDSAGFYTLEFSKPGFVTVYKNVFIGISAANSFNVAISPESVDGAYRIVLTWGENPNDLDSHMSGLTSSGSSFHVYYSSKNAFDGDSLICNLDLDDTTSYGPETITLNTNTASPYYYYVHRYSGSGSIATSNAQVKVYKGDTLLRTFNAPTDKGTADYWNVFAIVNGRIVINNTITSSPDTTYANVTNEEYFEENQDTESIGETNDVIQESEVTESNSAITESVESNNSEETEEITDSSEDEVPVDDAA